ncbi:ABC transporter permease [Clostridium botulinum]|nr:ABC transporter permease [Clostridium botulinum]NFP01791.1 ABC transporter permease [Clostridium botulinum]
MKTYSYLANKQFKVNKKRNFSIVLGIILSIILFTTVGYIQSFTREIDIINAKEERGNYEAIFKNISKEEAYKLKNNVLIRSVGIYKKEAEDKVKIGSLDKTIEVYALDSESIHNLFKPLIKISKGRYPVNKNEIILNQSANLELNKYIDDKITIGDKSYVIVGFCDNEKYSNPYVINGITYLEKELFDEHINVAIITEEIKNKRIEISNIANKIGISADEANEERVIKFNNRLFDSYGISVDENANYIDKYKMGSISLYGVILILSTILTYSSINVSVKERIQQFSSLRCIGATPSKIRILLMKESFLLIVFSLIPGIILGQIVCFIISGVIFNKIIGINTYGILYKVYWNVILTVILLSILNIIISTIIPIIKVVHISPIQGAKTGGEIKSSIKRGKYKIIKKLFGYNAELAYKNIRRGNKNFIITTFALSILLIIFITFTGYHNMIINNYSSERNKNKDVSMTVYTSIPNEFNKLNPLDMLNKYKSDITHLEVTDEINAYINYSIKALFKDVNLNKWIKTVDNKSNYGESIIYNNGKKYVYSNSISLLIYDDESINEILPYIENDINNKNNINLEDFKENGVIVAYRSILKNGFNPKKEEIFDLNIGENFRMYIDSSNINESVYGKDTNYIDNMKEHLNMKFLGSIDGDNLFEGNRYGFANHLTIIASDDFYENNKEILSSNNYNIDMEINLKKDLNRELSKDIIGSYANKIGTFYLDNEATFQNSRKSFLALSSLIYIVLFLTIFIGGVTILNNKNISILLRKKELGILLAIGINKKRLKKVLFFEGIIQWVISSSIGIISSYIILKVIYSVLYYSGEADNFRMPIISVLIGIFVLFIITFLGSYLPVRKLNQMETTELIRDEE